MQSHHFSRWIAWEREVHLWWCMLLCLLLFTKYSPVSVCLDNMGIHWWSDSTLTAPWKRRIILIHCSLNYWCPSSLCIINFVMVLGHQRETLLRSREWKTGSVGYCNQVEGQPKCLGKDLQMVIKKDDHQWWGYTNSWRGASDHTLGRKLEEEERAANFSF